MLITNATLLTWGENNRILENQAVYFQDGLIHDLGETVALQAKYPEAHTLDAKGQLLMPGNICAHTHFYGSYARGMAIPGEAPKDFPQILQRLWWLLDKSLDRDAVRASALVCVLDAIKHGTTALIDHHASPNFIEGSLDVIGEVVAQAGLRGVLCYEVTDRDGIEKAEAGIAENVRFIQSNTNPLLAGTFGLHASLTLGDETLQKCVNAIPNGVGFHIHVAEHEADQEDSLHKYGKRVVNRLADWGVLGGRSIAAHCIHIDETERDLLTSSGTWVTHQPRSNMNNGVGALDWDQMLNHEVRLALGNDGFSNNMFAEWKTAYLLHKVVNRDPREANGADVIRVATSGNARLLETYFPSQRFGEISIGAVADCILVDYKPFTPITGGNAAWHVLFGFESSMVTSTIVRGQVLMHDRQLLTIDENEVIAFASELAPKVWERYNQLANPVH
ncbi:MAG: putative aminohydrolase SsnA [Phototrophicaceae bacterium]